MIRFDILEQIKEKNKLLPWRKLWRKISECWLFAFKFSWSELRGWVLDQTAVAILQSNTPSLWRCKEQLLQLALMNQQLFVDSSQAIRLPVTQLHLSNLVYFTQGDLTNPQLKSHFHLSLRGWENAFEGLCSSDELGRGTKSNKVFLWQELGRDWDSWLLHYSKHVGGLSHALRCKRGALTWLTSLRGVESILCRRRVGSAVPYAAHTDSELFQLLWSYSLYLFGRIRSKWWDGPESRQLKMSVILCTCLIVVFIAHFYWCFLFSVTVTSRLPCWSWIHSEGKTGCNLEDH